ncbi:MAG: regulatory protein RecX [Alphaproteobacteria bacterium]
MEKNPRPTHQPQKKLPQKQNQKQQNQKPRQKQPKKITASYLHNSGLYYLERYAAGSGHFRSVMTRKIQRSCRVHTDQNFEECAAMLEEVISNFIRSGLLNDALYVESMVRNYRAKGLSRKMILNKLAAKRVDKDDIEAALSDYDDTAQASHSFSDDGNGNDNRIDTELRSAAIFCRKKKLGAYAATPSHKKTLLHDDDKYMQKQLGKLARAGFSYDISQKVLALDLDELIEIQNHG